MGVRPKFPARANTLRDVARAAKVGESTASRVLRNSGSFSDEARDRVLNAARTLNYVPNRIAGTLASTGSQLIGVIIPVLTTSVFPDLLRGANSVLESAGFQSVIGVTEYDPVREERLIESILSWRPAGIIVTGLEHTVRARAILKHSRIRVVEVGDTDGKGIDIVVGFSNRQAGRAAAEHLLRRGYRRIAYVGNQSIEDLRAGKRYDGFKDKLGEAGHSVCDEEITTGLSSIQAGRDGLMRLLKRHPQLDAVYFANDDMAIGGYFHCLTAGISIPQQLALFGHNGLDVGRLAPQPLSTIRTPRIAVGEIGAKLLLSNGPRQVIDLGFELFEGMTT
jgi:LacI family transcriptional regulator, gluconate utilization system Gnt-I transcriptional repressor